MAVSGNLYLVPNILADGTTKQVMGPQVAEIVTPIRHFAVEEIRSARRLMRQLVPNFPIDDSTFYSLTKDSKHEELAPMLNVLKSGQDLAIISEAGCPAIADPGALLVAEAHLLNIRVIPLVGPSSFILAIMGSGLNGQSFTFNGYLPIQETERIAVLKKLEEESRKTNRTQLFMETPYRNVTLWQTLLKVLHGNTRLCLAAGLTSPTEILVTKTVNQWKQFAVPAINKVPALFLFLAE